jgi:hypothetical protein
MRPERRNAKCFLNWDDEPCRGVLSLQAEDTLCVQGIGSRPKPHVSADGSGVVSHARARLLADLAEATGLTTAYSTALRPLRPRGTGHDPGRTATDLAVMLADGGEAIADPAVLRDQAGVSGQVAKAMGRPCRVHTRCSRRPQKNREWLAQ